MFRHKAIPTAIVLLALTFVLAACGGDNNTQTPPAPTNTATANGSPMPANTSTPTPTNMDTPTSILPAPTNTTAATNINTPTPMILPPTSPTIAPTSPSGGGSSGGPGSCSNGGCHGLVILPPDKSITTTFYPAISTALAAEATSANPNWVLESDWVPQATAVQQVRDITPADYPALATAVASSNAELSSMNSSGSNNSTIMLGTLIPPSVTAPSLPSIAINQNIGPSQWDAGEAAAQYILGHTTSLGLGATSEILLVEGYDSVSGDNPISNRRARGFTNTLGITYTGRIIEATARRWDISQATVNGVSLASTLTANPNVALIVGCSDALALGAKKVAEQNSPTTTTKAIGIGGDTADLSGDGLAAIVGFYPHQLGREAIRQLVNARTGPTPVPYWQTAATPVDINTLTTYQNADDGTPGASWPTPFASNQELDNLTPSP